MIVYEYLRLGSVLHYTLWFSLDMVAHIPTEEGKVKLSL
jgi:hypothetical protein